MAELLFDVMRSVIVLLMVFRSVVIIIMRILSLVTSYVCRVDDFMWIRR